MHLEQLLVVRDHLILSEVDPGVCLWPFGETE